VLPLSISKKSQDVAKKSQDLTKISKQQKHENYDNISNKKSFKRWRLSMIYVIFENKKTGNYTNDD